MRREQVPGLALVVIGGTLLVLLQVGSPTEIVITLIGAALLVVYAATRVYGFLIGGAALTGLGLGLVVDVVAPGGGAPLLGLAGGGGLIALIDRFATGGRPAWWWPLVPAAVLAVIGLAQLFGAAGWLTRWWPLSLILAGGWLFVRRWRTERALRRARNGGQDAT